MKKTINQDNNNENEEIPEGYNRVTEILAPYKTFAGVDDDVLEFAARRGTLVHYFCEMHALNMLIEKPPKDVKGYIESYKKWFDEYVEDVLFTEVRMNHSFYRISGQPDQVVVIKGSKSLILLDIKTPATKCRTWNLQTAAYRLMLREILGIQCDRRICLRLDKEGNFPKVDEFA